MVTTVSVGKPATLEMARGIFTRGTDCLGPEQVFEAHGKLHRLKLPRELPPLPWTGEELRAARAREKGAHIILVPPGLTMQEICGERENRGADGRKLLYDTDWYQGEEFFTTAPTGKDWDWRLVINEVVPNSTGQNYIEQTATLVNYLTNVVFAGRDLPLVYRQAADEFREQEEALTKLIDSDWQEAAKQISTLAINRLLRETPAVTFYRLVTYLKVTGARLLEGMYHWSPTLSSNGELVSFGVFDPDGARVYGWFPGDRHDRLGVVLSRSAKVESGG